MHAHRPRQLWRDEMIDTHERLQQLRLLLRKQCGIPSPPEDDDVAKHPYELNVIFRISQLVYGSAPTGLKHIPFQIMRLGWFREDGQLPEYVLRAYELLQEEVLREPLKRMYRFSVEHPFPAEMEALEDNDLFMERLGQHIARAFHKTESACAL